VLPLASGLLMIAMLFALNMSYGFSLNLARNARLQVCSGSMFLPSGRRNEQGSRGLFDGGREPELSVLFTDVRGFTTIRRACNRKKYPS